jgi:hypothetical protein
MKNLDTKFSVFFHTYYVRSSTQPTDTHCHNSFLFLFNLTTTTAALAPGGRSSRSHNNRFSILFQKTHKEKEKNEKPRVCRCRGCVRGMRSRPTVIMQIPSAATNGTRTLSLSPSLFYRRLRFSSSCALRKQTLATLPPTGSLSRSLRLCTLSYVSSRLVPLFPNWFTCSVWSGGPTSQFGLETSNPHYFSIG